MGEIRIGLLGVEHAAELQRVAERDSSTVPTGMVLGARVNGRLVAAHSVIDGTAVADPFVPTAELQALLSQRVKQIRGGHHSGLLSKLGRNGRRSRSRGSAPASPSGAGGKLLQEI